MNKITSIEDINAKKVIGNVFDEKFLNENINEGDEVISSELEHHSCVLPWQNVCNF